MHQISETLLRAARVHSIVGTVSTPAAPGPDGPVLDDNVVERLLHLRASIAREGEDVLGELLRLFIDDSDLRVQALRAAIAAANADQTRHAAHALKGASANLGALRVAALAHRLEREDSARTVETVDALQTALVDAIAALRTRFAP